MNNIYKVINQAWEVPLFSALEYFQRKNHYCVIIPVINEGDRILKQLEQMRKITSSIDAIIADAGSTDGSLKKSTLKKNNIRTLLTKIGPGRLSAQMRMALAYALQSGYEGMIFIDGNNKDDPQAIPNFIDALEDGFDHVQGSRYILGGIAINTPLIRDIAVKYIHAPLISLAAHHKYTDTTNGFRAYSAKFLLDPRVAPFREIFQEYELHYYLAIRAARLNFRVIEIPVTRAYPKKEKIPTKISPLKGNFKILKTLVKACLGLHDPEH